MNIIAETKEPKMQRPPVILIPWDPDSEEHVDRMVLQRIACGWKQDYVEGWRQQQREGKIGLHWIVSFRNCVLLSNAVYGIPV